LITDDSNIQTSPRDVRWVSPGFVGVL